MSELTPITRVESYLDAIVNSGIPPTEDITRIETFLQAIYDNTVCQLTPITRIEMFLGKISGQSLTLPEPITRIELYLAAIAGEDVELPENPITRLEMYLAEWADSGDWTTISGAIVEFITQRAHKLKSCVVSLSPKQDLSHGDPSPTNICPISGWTGCEVMRTGKNLFDSSKFTKSGWQLVADNYFNMLPIGTNLTFSIDKIDAESHGFAIQAIRDGTAYTLAGYTFGNSVLSVTVAVTKNVKYAQQFILSPNWNGLTAEMVDNAHFQIEMSDEQTEYEPYKGNSYSVTFGETVYGGYDEIVSGNGKANFGRYKFTGNEPTAQVSANKVAIKTANDWKSSQLGWCTDFKFDSTGATNWIYLNTTMSAEDVKTYMGSHDVYAVCELATPTDITTTPTPITALKGYNAMWSDGGDIEVTVHGTSVELSTQQALNMLLGGAYRNGGTSDDVSDDEALDIILGGENK